MERPLVSFIVPVKNSSALLMQALASCVAQTSSRWEAVVIDDNSEENTKAVVESFNDVRIRWYALARNEHGIAHARSAAIKKAKSDILVTLDADDINLPDRAYRCSNLLDTEKSQVIYTRITWFNHETGESRVKPVLQRHDPELLRWYNYITNPGTAFTRKAYDEAGGYYDADLGVAEDYELYLRMANAGAQFLCIDERHVYYRKGRGSATSNATEALKQNIALIRKKHKIEEINYERLCSLMSKELRDAATSDPDFRRIWC